MFPIAGRQWPRHGCGNSSRSSTTRPLHNERVTEVSVIIPTRNRCKLLELSLRSVFWQRNVDFETVVVDDGSTDETPRMLRSLGDRIRVVRHDRSQGVSEARNRGIAEARGTWVAFLDDDDLWAAEKLELQLEVLRRTGRRWAYSGAVEVGPDNTILSGQPPPSPEQVVDDISIRNMLPAGASNVIVEKAWLPAPSVFDAHLRHSADWDLWIRLARREPPACVAKPLVAYRFHSASASLDLAGMYSETDEIDRRYGGPVDRSGFNRYLAKFARRVGWRKKALQYYCRAAMTGGRRYPPREFLHDIGMLFSDVVNVPGNDPYAAWKEEAGLWIDRLVRPDSRSAA